MSTKHFPACPCTICGEGGHVASKCTAIKLPPDGFYTGGGGGGGGHSHDDDDERATTHVLEFVVQQNLLDDELPPTQLN